MSKAASHPSIVLLNKEKANPSFFRRTMNEIIPLIFYSSYLTKKDYNIAVIINLCGAIYQGFPKLEQQLEILSKCGFKDVSQQLFLIAVARYYLDKQILLQESKAHVHELHILCRSISAAFYLSRVRKAKVCRHINLYAVTKTKIKLNKDHIIKQSVDAHVKTLECYFHIVSLNNFLAPIFNKNKNIDFSTLISDLKKYMEFLKSAEFLESDALRINATRQLNYFYTKHILKKTV